MEFFDNTLVLGTLKAAANAPPLTLSTSGNLWLPVFLLRRTLTTDFQPVTQILHGCHRIST